MERIGGLAGKILALALFSLLLVSCGNNEIVSQDPSTSSIPEGFALVTGKVAITGEVQQADVYAMGQEAQGVKTDVEGNFSLLVDCGTSGPAASASATASEKHLLIFHNQDSTYGLTQDIQVTDGGTHEISEVVLLPTGSITGNVTLQGQADHSGITVYLPGTSYVAMTDASGNFTIVGVPEGTYDLLRGDFTGYHHFITLNVSVASGLSTTIEPQTLLLSTGASGQISIESGSEFITSLDVTLTVGATEDAVLMMISENINFMGANWQPIQSLVPYTFSSEGQKTIYIKFADANGLESSMFADSVYIDANPTVSRISPVSTTNETMPTLMWEYTLPMQNPSYHVQVAYDESFSQIFMDQSGLANPEYTFSSPLQNLATYHWRVAIIDESGFEWGMAGPWSFTVDMDTVSLIEPANLSTADTPTPTFAWQPNEAAASYVLTLSDSPDLSGGTDYVTSDTSYTLPAPLPDAAPITYYWAVTPVDGNGVEGTRSDIWSFVLHTGLLVSDIAFPDNNLRNCVLATGATYADEIAVLHCGLSGIGNLSGIEHLTNLSELDLQHNNISDITSLAGLTNLQALALNNNLISDVTALSGLTRLFNLHLENNNITDVSALSGLTEMISLYLGYNSIANVSPLSGFPVLFDLHLDNNIITAGVADLATLPLTSWIYLAGNNGIPCADLQVLIDTFGAVQIKAPSSCASPITVWEISTADWLNHVGNYSSLALDSAGNAHISHYDFSIYPGYLKYTTNAGGNWATTVVDNNVTGYRVGTSIAVDGTGKVHISYEDNNNLYYATTDSQGIWVTDGVDISPDVVGDMSSIALDSNNTVHISYVNYTTRHLKYATGTLGSWAVETIDSSEPGIYGSSIAVDSQDNVHIAYRGGQYSATTLKYATGTSGAWNIETVDTYVTEFVSIAIGPSDTVHISYNDSPNSALKYATGSLGSWSTEFVDTPGDVGRYNSIALDAQGHVHISYYELIISGLEIGGKLKYATNSSGAWVASVVDGAGNVGENSSIAIDSNGNVHISCLDRTNGDLKYARTR